MMRFRSDPDEGVRSSHQGADFSGGTSGLQNSMARRWLSVAKYLTAPIIILLAVAILLPVFMNARKPGLETRCMAQLREVATAVSMYSQDYENYPLTRNWHTAVRTYVEDPHDEDGRIPPGSDRDPLTCPSDPTNATVSYLYLNRNSLDWSKAHVSESIIPMAVDEYFHEHTTLVFYDGHAEKLEKPQWLHTRNRQWEIRRNLGDVASFSYEPVPGSVQGPQDVAPSYDRTSVYVWPELQ